MLTVADVCDAYLSYREMADYGNQNRHLRTLVERIGHVPMCELTRQRVWDVFAEKNWPTRLEALSTVKRAFNFGVKPTVDWSWDEVDAPQPMMSRYDNPLDGVRVNLIPTYVCQNEKRQQQMKELEYLMAEYSDAADEEAQKRKGILG